VLFFILFFVLFFLTPVAGGGIHHARRGRDQCGCERGRFRWAPADPRTRKRAISSARGTQAP
jgi:hypothetical protein